jgi:hypothetical protein
LKIAGGPGGGVEWETGEREELQTKEIVTLRLQIGEI